MSLLPLISTLSSDGPLEHGDQQRVAVAIQCDVAEESGRVQRPQRLAQPLRIELIADVDRQVIEHRAFGDALQALDLDVADGEIGVARRAAAPSAAAPSAARRTSKTNVAMTAR